MRVGVAGFHTWKCLQTPAKQPRQRHPGMAVPKEFCGKAAYGK